MSNNVSQKTQVYFGQYLNKVFKSSVEVVYMNYNCNCSLKIQVSMYNLFNVTLPILHTCKKSNSYELNKLIQLLKEFNLYQRWLYNF